MATPILGIDELSDGQANQYATANEAFRALEAASNAFTEVDLSSGNATLTDEQFAASVLFRSSGNTVARDLQVPASLRMFLVDNGGSAELSVVRGTTTIAVSSGSAVLLYSDGTANGLLAVAGGSGGGGYDELSDFSYSNSNLPGVSNAEEALDDLASAAGVSDFEDLGDTFSFAGNAGKLARVKSDESGLEPVEYGPPLAVGTTTTSYTLSLAIWGQVKTLTGSGTIEIGIPDDATLDLPVGYFHIIRPREGFTGTAEWVPESGSVGVEEPADGSLLTPPKGTTAALKVGANDWVVMGLSEEASS